MRVSPGALTAILIASYAGVAEAIFTDQGRRGPGAPDTLTVWNPKATR